MNTGLTPRKYRYDIPANEKYPPFYDRLKWPKQRSTEQRRCVLIGYANLNTEIKSEIFLEPLMVARPR